MAQVLPFGFLEDQIQFLNGLAFLQRTPNSVVDVLAIGLAGLVVFQCDDVHNDDFLD